MALHLFTEAIPEPIVLGLESLRYSLASQSHNPRISGILDETVLFGGKRIRPLLTFLMGDFFGLSREQITPYALDIERIHAATLAHDDVVDDARTRRGRPSINRVVSNKKAILAGDYLLAQVLYSVAQRGDNRVVRELSRVIADLAEGEWLQIENSENPELCWQHIEEVALKKTGSVIRWCCMAPCLISGASAELVELTSMFGEKIGIAFQLGDDILDFRREDDQALADINNGTINAVIFESLAREGVLDAREVRELDLTKAAIDAGIEKIRMRITDNLTAAKEAFTKIAETVGNRSASGEATRQALAGMIDYLGHRI